jgi:hypothetical protein
MHRFYLPRLLKHNGNTKIGSNKIAYMCDLLRIVHYVPFTLGYGIDFNQCNTTISSNVPDLHNN